MFGVFLRRIPSVCVLTLAVALTSASGHAGAKPVKASRSHSHSGLPKGPSVIDPELRAALKSAPKPSDYPDEDYACLLDIGSATLQPDGTRVEDYRAAYKLFKDDARDMAEVDVPYNASYQTVTILRARTITKAGKVLDLDPKDIRDNSPYSDYALYDDTRSVGFSLPGIENGCVIDYTYRTVSKPWVTGGFFAEHWRFENMYPVGLSRYTLTLPAARPLQIKAHNNATRIKPTVTASKDGRMKTYAWQMSRLKSVELEPMMPPMSEVIASVEVSTIPSWQDISRWYWKLAKPQAASSPTLKATVAQLTAGKTTDEEKARVLYEWVAKRVRYVGLEFGESAFKPHPAPQVYAKLYGDCKDKATLLIAMLGLAGIKAHPVLLNPGSRHEIPKRLPDVDAFDHCIVYMELNGKPYWLDPTDEDCPFGQIPGGDRDTDALVVEEGSGKFRAIPDVSAAEKGFEGYLGVQLKPNGDADAEVKMTFRGDAAQAFRAQLKDLSAKKEKEMMEAMAPSISPGATLKDYTLPKPTDPDLRTVTMVARFSAPGWAKTTGNLMLLPAGLRMGDPNIRNPFTKPTRKWPIVSLAEYASKGTVQITLPDGYEAMDVPKGVDLVGQMMEYHSTFTPSADGSALTITEKMSAHPARIPAADYAKVKGFYDEAVKSDGAQLVLRKKGV